MPAPPRLWRDWLAACVAGEAVGIGIGAAAAGLALLVVGEPDAAAERWGVFALMVGAGALEGLALGGLQWRVLRRPFPTVPARDWVGATVAVAVAGWALGMLPPTLMAPGPSAGPPADPGLGAVAAVAAAGGAVAGVGFGAAQWVVLRRHVADAGLWVGANAAAWSLAMVWITVAASTTPAGAPLGVVAVYGVVGGAASGLTVGGVTGWALVRLAGRGGRTVPT